MLLFCLLPLPYLVPHNVLYDTSGRGGVKLPVLDLYQFVNTELSTGSNLGSTERDKLEQYLPCSIHANKQWIGAIHCDNIAAQPERSVP